MTPKKIGAGILGTTALVFGGVDATKLDETPIERVETVAGYQVEAKQIENRVETSFPWKDQPAIKVVYDMGEPTLAEKFKDKRKKEVVTEVVDFGDGGFKVDILLDEKPDTNVFCYTIQGAENYDFFYQPPLTADEIAEGASRPPQIDGSYAVYHKTLKNHQIGKENYATGKVMHIPRPQVWSMSDVETKVWADMNYDNGNLCVTVPQDFLDKAEYPVRVDPTFGYTTAGGTAFTNLLADDSLMAKYTLIESGDVTSIHYYSNDTSSVIGTKGVIYDDDGASAIPNTLMATGSIVSINTTPNWRTSSTTVSLSAGDWWVGFICAGTACVAYRDAGTDTYRIYLSTTYASPASPPGSFSTTTSSYFVSTYATYTATGGGGGSSTTPNQDIILFE